MGSPTVPVEGAPPEPNELDAMKAQLAAQSRKVQELEGALRSKSPSVPQPPPSQAPDPKALENEFWKNPVGITAAIVQRGVQEAVQQSQGQNFELLRQLAKNQARSADQELFDKYEAEIEAKVGQVHPQFHTNPTVWINAFNVVKGEKMQEILRERREGPVAPALRIPKDGPAPPSPKAPPEPSKRELTPEQLEVARRLKLTEDQYRAGLEHYERQSDTGKSSWDEVLTFDSDAPRGGSNA